MNLHLAGVARLREVGCKHPKSSALTKKKAANQLERPQHGSQTPSGAGSSPSCSGEAVRRVARHRGSWHRQLCPGFSRKGKGVPGDRLCSELGFGGKVQLLAVRGSTGWFAIKLSPSRSPSPTPCGQRSSRPWCKRVSGAGTVAGQLCTAAAQFPLPVPHVHTTSRTQLSVSELLGQGQGWTQRLVGAATSPRHHLLQQHKGEDPPIRMYLSPVPTRYYRHLTTMQGNERANIPSSAPRLHTPLSYVLHGGSQDVGSREQTRSRSDGKSLNELDLAETLRRGSVNLLAVMLPASCGALDPGGESPCRWEGRKLSAERC